MNQQDKHKQAAHYLVRTYEGVGAMLHTLKRALPGIAVASVLISVTTNVLANNAPTTSAQALTTVGTMFADAMTLGLALVAAVIFVIVAWAVVTKFNDARRGRADWGEVILPFIIGAGVVIFVGWLVTEGNTAVGNITGGPPPAG